MHARQDSPEACHAAAAAAREAGDGNTLLSAANAAVLQAVKRFMQVALLASAADRVVTGLLQAWRRCCVATSSVGHMQCDAAR